MFKSNSICTGYCFYFILNENDIVTVYNIYKWTALIMFVSVMAVSIIDVALVEKSGKGYNNESN